VPVPLKPASFLGPNKWEISHLDGRCLVRALRPCCGDVVHMIIPPLPVNCEINLPHCRCRVERGGGWC
jgi:hypothetical protein